ncbi:DUF2894 domain-containing protein [Dyella japonica]|uniref:DUF2894 domain-containing protein n=1 Tax=Dyella japonica TaxID=231455 RepID=A0ABV2JZ92_9GAMM
MSPSVTRARAMLDAWREQHADRLDPVRFHAMDALERRAANHDGEARRMLDDRLATLLDAYAGDLENAATVADPMSSETPNRSALAELIDHMAASALARDVAFAAHNATMPSSSYPTLETLDEFKKIWSAVRTGSQLRQSLEQAPENAGPLNSGALVHRSIGLMRELSPGYLQQFLSYIDALSWIEQINGSALPASDAPRAPGTRKRGKAKSRTT